MRARIGRRQERLRGKLLKRLDRLYRGEVLLSEDSRSTLTEILNSPLLTDRQKAKAKEQISKLDARLAEEAGTDANLEKVLADFDSKPTVTTDSEPAPSPEPKHEEPAPVPEIDHVARAARIAVIQEELRKIEFQNRLMTTGQWKPVPQEWELHHSHEMELRSELEKLTAQPKPEPVSPEEREAERQRKLREAAMEKYIQEMREENMRAAGEWPTSADIAYRFRPIDEIPDVQRMPNGDLYVGAPNTWDRYTKT